MQQVDEVDNEESYPTGYEQPNVVSNEDSQSLDDEYLDKADGEEVRNLTQSFAASLD